MKCWWWHYAKNWFLEWCKWFSKFLQEKMFFFLKNLRQNLDVTDKNNFDSTTDLRLLPFKTNASLPCAAKTNYIFVSTTKIRTKQHGPNFWKNPAKRVTDFQTTKCLWTLKNWHHFERNLKMIHGRFLVVRSFNWLSVKESHKEIASARINLAICIRQKFSFRQMISTAGGNKVDTHFKKLNLLN